MFYAHIDENSICIGVMQLARPVLRADYIAISGLDTSLLGKKWQGGKWVVA